MMFLVELSPDLESVSGLSLSTSELDPPAVDGIAHPSTDERLEFLAEGPTIGSLNPLVLEPSLCDRKVTSLQRLQEDLPIGVPAGQMIGHAVRPILVQGRVAGELLQRFVGLVADVESADDLACLDVSNSLVSMGIRIWLLSWLEPMDKSARLPRLHGILNVWVKGSMLRHIITKRRGPRGRTNRWRPNILLFKRRLEAAIAWTGTWTGGLKVGWVACGRRRGHSKVCSSGSSSRQLTGEPWVK